ncbi:MAG TPA: TolC family protein [Candidatus Nitrosotenuis sp.]|nr:TolC family protein [Candidatus Nitrosotenuis sp.]
MRALAAMSLILALLCAGTRAAPEASRPALPLLPREAMVLALEHHPALAAARRRALGAREFAEGAGAQPNPELRLAAVRGDPQESAQLLVQRLEVGGQPGLRARAAGAEAQAAFQDLLALQRQVTSRAAVAYYDLWEAVQRTALARTRLELARELEETSRRRYEVGEISRHLHLLTELERSRAEAELASAEAQEEAARGTLNLLLGRPPQAALELPLPSQDGAPQAPALPFPEPESLEALRREAPARPEVESLQQRARAARLEADLAARAALPDLELAAYRSSLGPLAEEGVSLTLVAPLFDWGLLGAEQTRRRREAEARALDAEARRLEVDLEIQAAWQVFQASRRRRGLLRAQVERYQSLAAMARRGYEAGLLGLVEVLETERSFRQAVLDYVAAEAAYHRGLLEVRRASGAPLLPQEAP